MKKSKIVETAVEHSHNFNDLIVLEQLPVEKIKAAKASIDVNDTNSITSYGVAAQKAVNSVSDSILASAKNRDFGPVAESLNKIVLGVRGLDTNGLAKEQGWLSKLIGKASPVVNFLASYETTISQIDSIIDHLDSHRGQLSRSVAELDVLYSETEVAASNLEIYIAALKEKMAEFEDEILPTMKQRADDEATPMASQEYADCKAVYDRLSRKHNNLSLTRQITLQNLPSIRLTQDHDVALLEKINDVEINLVPLWKRQLAIALENSRTIGAGQAVNAATDLTNEMLVAGAKQLGQAQIEARKTIERGLIDIQAVEEANTILIGTLTTVQGMINTARVNRVETEKRIANAEQGLRKAITAG